MGSQAYQDVFALKTAQHNTYIEIGANDPVLYNNTYLLEKNGWKGISLELHQENSNQWIGRKNKIYYADAIFFDYLAALKENNLPTHIGYLSCDIEPPENTFAALKKVIEQGITFDCITFEHDIYRSEIDYNCIATKYLEDQGYKVAVTEVYHPHPQYHFETWYVKKDIDYKSILFDDWKNLIMKC